MGQKVNPVGLRLKINREWDSVWYAKKENYAKTLHEDLAIREVIRNRFNKSGVIRTKINRLAEKIHIELHCTKPGVVIGQRGKNIESLKEALSRLVTKSLDVKIMEVKKPDASAQALAEGVALQLQDRVAFRRAMKHALRSAIRAGVLGVKVMVSGRLNGADMARTEQYREGRIPLHTLRALIDYGFAEADTTYGKIGVKVWVYTGDSLEGGNSEEDQYKIKRRES